jgi:uncharacterized protein (TIGR04255 family)
VYPNREVFPNAPLALVAAEIRFTDAARLRQQQTKDEIAIALEERFPFAESLQQASFNLTLGGGTPQVQEQQGVVLKDAASIETLTIMAESLTYETTAYENFESLLETVTSACNALVDAKVRPALQRVGLRYIDEVRVSEDIVDVRQWKTWINERLVGQIDVGPNGFPATVYQAVSTFDLGEGRGLNLRCAALNQGTSPSSPARSSSSTSTGSTTSQPKMQSSSAPRSSTKPSPRFTSRAGPRSRIPSLMRPVPCSEEKGYDRHHHYRREGDRHLRRRPVRLRAVNN